MAIYAPIWRVIHRPVRFGMDGRSGAIAGRSLYIGRPFRDWVLITRDVGNRLALQSNDMVLWYMVRFRISLVRSKTQELAYSKRNAACIRKGAQVLCRRHPVYKRGKIRQSNRDSTWMRLRMFWPPRPAHGACGILKTNQTESRPVSGNRLSPRGDFDRLGPSVNTRPPESHQ